MVSPTEIISDIQNKLSRLVREHQELIAYNIKLKEENNSLANSLEESIKQQESFRKKLDSIRQETLKENKGLDQWKVDTRKEIRGLMKEVEKCIPQIEAMLENK